MLKVLIDGQPVNVPNGATILQACEQLGVEIPTLCYLKHLNPEGSCRMCVVEVKGVRNLQVACATPCTDGMQVTTMNDRIFAFRRMIVELLAANHNRDCFSCPANGKCKLSQYAMEYNVGMRTFSWTSRVA